MRTSKKLVIAAAMAVTLLIGLATPAAAGGPFPLEIGTPGGTLETAIGDFDLTPDGDPPPPCPDKEDTLALWTDDDAAGPGTWMVTGGFSGQFELPAGSGDWYQADFQVLFAQGGYVANPTPPPDYFLFGTDPNFFDLGFQVDIYDIGVDDCEKDELECTILGVFGIVSGEFHGTLPNPAPGDFALVTADTITSGVPLVAAPCNPPFVGVNGTNATIRNLKLVVQ